MFLEFVHTVKYSDFSWCWFIFHTKSLLQRQTHWSASSEQNKRWVRGHRNIELYDFKDMKNTVLHLFLPLPLQPSFTCPSPPKSHSLYSYSSFSYPGMLWTKNVQPRIQNRGGANWENAKCLLYRPFSCWIVPPEIASNGCILPPGFFLPSDQSAKGGPARKHEARLELLGEGMFKLGQKWMKVLSSKELPQRSGCRKIPENVDLQKWMRNFSNT